jgi:Predicted endonuclease containing a URI domain
MNCYRQLDTTCDKCGAVIKQYNKILGLCSNCYYLEKIQFLLKTENELLNTKAFELFTKFYETLIKYRTSKSTFESLVSQLDFFKYISKCDIIDKFSYDFFSYLKEEYNFILSIKLENFLIRENLLTPLTEMEEFIKLSKYYLSKVSTIFFAEYKSFTNYMLERKCKLTRNGWQGKFKLSTYELILYCSQKFLYFLSDKINSINELTNELLDEYFTQKQWTKSHLHYFIKWLNKSVRLFHKLNIIKVKQHVSICTPYTEEELFEIVENLNLSNSFMHKVLGFLLILYGIRPSEIVELKMSDYLSDSSKLFIRNVWISLNPYIKKILDGYIKFERSDKLSMGNKVDWLFYGYKFNTHLSKGRVGVILRRYKLDVKKSFCTAVTNLILNNKSVPSVVIHGTGINISTVMNYYKALNIDSAYNLELDHNFMYVEQSVKTSRYYIYILKCNDGSYYTGYTSNLQKRLQQHQEGTGCTYTKTRTPVELVYTEELPDKPSALKREKQIKKLTIFDKEKLIEKSRVN